MPPQANEKVALSDLPELTAYVVSPRDVIVARACDKDDHISWLLDHGCRAEALDLATHYVHELHTHRPVDIAELHIGSLLSQGQPAAAAKVCAIYFGESTELWVRWLRVFCARGQLQHIAPHVPVSDPKLPAEAYENALAAALAVELSSPRASTTALNAMDSVGEAGSQALALLRRWPPSLYRPSIAQRMVLDAARQLSGGLLAHRHLVESVVLLHCAANQHEAALSLLLRLPSQEASMQHSTRTVCVPPSIAALAATCQHRRFLTTRLEHLSLLRPTSSSLWSSTHFRPTAAINCSP